MPSIGKMVLTVLSFAVISLKVAAEPTPSAAPSLVPLDKPFTFSYLAWEKKAHIEAGAIILNAKGMTPKGGAGVVGRFDWSGHDNDAPALKVKVNPANTMKAIKFLARDEAGHSATWRFELPAAGESSTQIYAADGASWARPNEVGKEGPLALGKVMQWQLIGDWSGDGPVDLRIEAILAVKPNADILRARTERDKKEEAARVQAEKDRIAARARYQRGPESPKIETVYAAAPDVLAIQIREGKLTPCTLSDYQPQKGDEKNRDNHLVRNGKDLGLLIGPRGRETGLVRFEGFSGDPLLLAEADDAANFRISSDNDAAFDKALMPVQVMRKSKADDWQQFSQGGVVVVHRIYLKLPTHLTPGKSYIVAYGQLNTDAATSTLRFEPAANWSESIHVNQAGFRPDDPLKQAFLSLWMGNGGGYEFGPGLDFHLIDAVSGGKVYSGKVGSPWPAAKPERMHSERNFNGASVYPIDFSEFKTPGKYRLMIDGIGCSYLFEIAKDVWKQAFRVQMKGFYNERSGVDLGPPYTDFVRPACLKTGVNDALPVTQSTFSVVDGNPNGKGGLVEGDTGKPVPEAWGGYHDAGDWNPRRVDHMRTTTFLQLELLELFPEYFAALKLNIPNDAPGPDLLKECLFELDLFRRLQMPDGGCRFGIETEGDPSGGEVSWKQHLPGYVYAPDIYSSYVYASVAARAAQVLEAYDNALAKTYRDSALKAMQWAEADRARRKANGTWEKIPNRGHEIYQNRNLAAVCMYALTRDERWHKVFLDDTGLRSKEAPKFYGNYPGRDAAFTYARLPEGVGDAPLKASAKNAVVADADGSLAYQSQNAFGIASDDPGKPQFIGFYTNPHGAISLVRAHRLTGDAKYLAGAVKTCLFSTGANPNNLVYTSGVGTNYVKAMNMDAIATGQKPPIGLTPYGNIDLTRWHENWIVWPINFFIGKHCQPSCFDWPTTEAYFDVRYAPAFCEFCIDQTMGPNAYVWGYLAARK